MEAAATDEAQRAQALPVNVNLAVQRVIDSLFVADQQHKGTPQDTLTHYAAVVHRGSIVAERHRHDFSPRTRHLVWSLTKSLTSTMMGILNRQHRLSLDDPAGLPVNASYTGFDSSARRGRLTLEHLIQMRSGMHFKEVYTDPLSDVWRMLFLESNGGAFAVPYFFLYIFFFVEKCVRKNGKGMHVGG